MAGVGMMTVLTTSPAAVDNSSSDLHPSNPDLNPFNTTKLVPMPPTSLLSEVPPTSFDTGLAGNRFESQVDVGLSGNPFETQKEISVDQIPQEGSRLSVDEDDASRTNRIRPDSPEIAHGVCSCGNQLAVDAKYCRKCGKKVEEAVIEDDGKYQDLWKALQDSLENTEFSVRKLDKASGLEQLPHDTENVADAGGDFQALDREMPTTLAHSRGLARFGNDSELPPPPALPPSGELGTRFGETELLGPLPMLESSGLMPLGDETELAPAMATLSRAMADLRRESDKRERSVHQPLPPGSSAHYRQAFQITPPRPPKSTIAHDSNGSAAIDQQPPRPPKSTKAPESKAVSAAGAWANSAAETVVGSAQSSAAADIAVRTALAGDGSAAVLDADSLIEALERANGAVHAERVLLTEVLKQPISLFNLSAEAEGEALQRGVPGWAYGTLRIAMRLVNEACRLEDWKDTCATQIRAAKRINSQVKRAPLLELLESLDTLAGRLHDHLPAVRVAREALDAPARGTPGEPGGALVAGFGNREVQLIDEEPELPPEDFGKEPPKILRDRPKNGRTQESTPTCCWSACGACGSKTRNCFAQALEFFVDALLVLGTRAHVVRAGDDAQAHRHSPWMRVLLATWQEARRSSNEIGSEQHSWFGEAPSEPRSIAGKCALALKNTVDVEVSQPHPAVLPPLETHYWAFRGLGAPMRMMCVYAGANVKDVKYEVKKKANGHWACHEWEHSLAGLRSQNPLAQLPYVLNKDTGQVVSQSNAVYLYLGRVLRLNGQNETEQLANEQVLFHVYQMWMEVFDLVYPFKQNKDHQDFMRSLESHITSILPAHYKKLDKWLEQLGTGFFASWRLCTADFHVWEIFDQHEIMASKHVFKSPLKNFPRLQAFHRAVRTDTRLQPYFDSADFKLPINNKMAFFK